MGKLHMLACGMAGAMKNAVLQCGSTVFAVQLLDVHELYMVLPLVATPMLLWGEAPDPSMVLLCGPTLGTSTTRPYFRHRYTAGMSWHVMAGLTTVTPLSAVWLTYRSRTRVPQAQAPHAATRVGDGEAECTLQHVKLHRPRRGECTTVLDNADTDKMCDRLCYLPSSKKLRNWNVRTGLQQYCISSQEWE